MILVTIVLRVDHSFADDWSKTQSYAAESVGIERSGWPLQGVPKMTYLVASTYLWFSRASGQLTLSSVARRQPQHKRCDSRVETTSCVVVWWKYVCVRSLGLGRRAPYMEHVRDLYGQLIPSVAWMLINLSCSLEPGPRIWYFVLAMASLHARTLLPFEYVSWEIWMEQCSQYLWSCGTSLEAHGAHLYGCRALIERGFCTWINATQQSFTIKWGSSFLSSVRHCCSPRFSQSTSQ